MRIEPKPRDSGVEFTNSLVGQNVDRVFVPSVEKGVNQACTEGILAGCRVTDVKIDFYDGKMHPVDSKDIAFQIAGYFAFKEAFAAAKPCLLEPIETVEIRIPEDCMGKVMGDLSIAARQNSWAWTPTARFRSSRRRCRRRNFTIIPAPCVH